MKLTKFILIGGFTLALVLVLNKPLLIKDSQLPALGPFFNPFQGFWNNTEADLLDFDSKTFDQLIDDVEVKVDDRGVPHIFAQNMADAIFVQGYLTANDRLWQMEITHRSASGRLSEIFGEKALNSDIKNRKIGNEHYAKSRIEKWREFATGDEKVLLKQYTAGVNAYINTLDERSIPFEYKLFNHYPQEFSELHSTLIVTKMAQRLCGRETDLEKTNLLASLGAEEFNYLYPEYNNAQSPIVADSNQVFYPNTANIPDQKIRAYNHEPFEKPNPSNGSNNWAVAGSKTKSGKPILCNDPHLGMTLPSVWYEIQIHTPDMNVYGVTLPGIPGVIIGFNEDIAWGVTNVSQDVTDFYRVTWSNKEKTQYEYLGETKSIEAYQDTIEILGKDPHIQTLKYTELGPVVYTEEDHPEQDLIMRWLVNEEPTSFELSTFINLCKAKNYTDYRKALSNYSIPAQNFVFADNNGDIAITVTGKFPIKAEGQGKFIYDEIKEDYLWKGYIPFDSLPHSYNPENGFVGSANQHSTSPNYPYYYNGFFDQYRGRILHKKLSELENISTQDMMDLQNDSESLLAHDLNPLLLELVDESGFNTLKKEMIQMLRAWDYSFDKSSKAPIVFYEWWQNIYKLTWDEIDLIAKERAVSKPEGWRTIELIKLDQSSNYFDVLDTDKKEAAKDVINLAFEETYNALKDKINDESYDWGSYWSADVLHLSKLPSLSHPDLRVSGFKHALNAIRGNHGPSWRMIVELDDYPKAYGVYPGGQSGNPSSEYYDSNLEAWQKGEYFELQFMKDPKDKRFGSNQKTIHFKKS
jgi:penicillin amidase